MATGTTTVDFGSFPGTDQARTVITGQTSILSGSLCEAYIDPTAAATAAHTVGEHAIADIDVRCETIVAGTGFTIVANTRGAFQYGTYNVIWVWV